MEIPSAAKGAEMSRRRIPLPIMLSCCSTSRATHVSSEISIPAVAVAVQASPLLPGCKWQSPSPSSKTALTSSRSAKMESSTSLRVTLKNVSELGVCAYGWVDQRRASCAVALSTPAGTD